MPDTDPLIIKNATRIARAISHPVRLQILNELRQGGAYVMHLTAVLGRPQANISQHLMVLRQAGLVRDEREGMSVIYYVRDARVGDIIDQLMQIARDHAKQPLLASASQPDMEAMPQRRRSRQGRCRCPRCRKQAEKSESF